jgi:radical SAM superfamily enzyme YgiQ (UPF0313 family)
MTEQKTKQKKILLVRVNSNIETAPVPLGLMYIASYFRSREKDAQVSILDGRNKDIFAKNLISLILNYNPDFIGITCMHAEKDEVHAVVRSLKKKLPKAVIVLGGPYASSDYHSAANDENIDFVVVGEGEETFYDLVNSSYDGYKNLSEIKGLVYRQEGRVKFNGYRAFWDDLNTLPFPAWDLINLNDYFYGKKKALENPLQIYKKAVPILSSRGCPYQCTYCHDIFGKKFRARSPENILSEIEFLINNYGIREIEFLDDAFNIDKLRAEKIFSLIIERDLKIKICFSNGIRLDRIDDRALNLMKKAGVYRVNYGIESASERIQASIKKNLKIGIVKDVISQTVNKGILCGGFFMLGFPTETEEEAIATIQLAISSKLHTAVFGIATPFPGTEMFRSGIAEKRIFNNTDFYDAQKIIVNLSKISDKRLEELRYYAYRRFYFDPIRALRIFLGAPAKIPVFKNFLEVFKVAFLKKALYAK